MRVHGTPPAIARGFKGEGQLIARPRARKKERSARRTEKETETKTENWKEKTLSCKANYQTDKIASYNLWVKSCKEIENFQEKELSAVLLSVDLCAATNVQGSI